MNNQAAAARRSREAALRDMAGLATPMALRVAATLRLPDLIGGHGATAADLAAWTRTSPVALTRLLDHLISLRVLEHIDGRYRNNELGDCLREEIAGATLRDDLDIGSALGRAELAFVELLHTVATGRSGYERHYGRDFWTDLAATPALQSSFDAKMTRRIRIKAEQIARRFDWSRYPRLVDVGGGQGSLLAAILDAHPELHGQLVDLPATATRAADAFATAGLTHRATTTAGSFFDPLPTGADAYILHDILHDWDDQHAHLILGQCAMAAGTSGNILVIEAMRDHNADTGIDLAMMVFFGGRERSQAELTTLAAQHHLTLSSTTQVAVNRTLLEFTPT